MKIIKNIKRLMGDACIILLSAFVLTLTSCDEHEPVDLDIHPGYILCDDGRIIKETDYDPGQHTPVGVVFAPLATDKHPVLAVLLEEVDYIQFSDTLSFDQKTSCDEEAYDGYKNTVSLWTTNILRKELVDSVHLDNLANYYKSPLAHVAFRSHFFAQSDYVPSIAEMRLLFQNITKVNEMIIKCGGTPISRSPMGAGCWYWTSTEVKENSMNQAWLISMADGSIHKAPKTNSYRARLIVEYNPYNIVTN